MHRALGCLLILLASCNREHQVRPGDLDVVWRGAERGRFIAPLEAKHCAESGIVELLAIRGDSGFAAALFLKDSATIAPTAYQVVPGSLLDEPRPGASAGLRWFGGTSISAFEGTAGMVTLSLAGQTLSGTLEIKYQALDTPDTLRLTGTFSQVPVTMADSGCRLIQKRNRV